MEAGNPEARIEDQGLPTWVVKRAARRTGGLGGSHLGYARALGTRLGDDPLGEGEA